MELTNIEFTCDDNIVKFEVEMAYPEYEKLCQRDKDYKILKVHEYTISKYPPFHTLSLTPKEWKDLGVDLRSLWYGKGIQNKANYIGMSDDMFEKFISL